MPEGLVLGSETVNPGPGGVCLDLSLRHTRIALFVGFLHHCHDDARSLPRLACSNEEHTYLIRYFYVHTTFSFRRYGGCVSIIYSPGSCGSFLCVNTFV